MRSDFSTGSDGDEPSAEELNAIEHESGLIAAEMALLDAEIRIMAAGDQPRYDPRPAEFPNGDAA